MNNLIWKIKSTFRKYFPIALMGFGLYWAFGLYQSGSFRRGVPSLTTVLHKMPYFGVRFKHYGKGSSSYSYRKSYKRGNRKHHGRRHGRRRR